MIPAEIVEQYVDNSTETLNFSFIAVPEGILIEIEEVQYKKHWQTKPFDTRIQYDAHGTCAFTCCAFVGSPRTA